jgi:hypothetical protein
LACPSWFIPTTGPIFGADRSPAPAAIWASRPIVGAPRYGGHIERLIGSVMSEMHLLPGATFSNVAARGGYDSEAAAVMTIDEFEIGHLRTTD